MGSGSRSRRGNDPEGDRRAEGQAREGLEIASLGSRFRSAGSAWGSFILAVDHVDSTNVLASSLARKGAPHGSVFLARFQSGGKGRWGRRWESPEGGLYLSLVLRPREGEAKDLGVLPLLAAVAAAEGLLESAGLSCELRWPNDLLFEGRKLGGILCESSFRGSEWEFAVVGIGINVNQTAQDFTRAISRRATSVRAILGREIEPFDLGVAVALSLERWWEREAASRVLDRWRELAPDLERARVRVVPREGEEYEASIVGLADDGGLEVRVDDGGARVLRSDEVRLLDEAEGGYYEEVERHFVSRRGSPLFITPGEWDLVLRWERMGIPLAVVKEGIDRVFDRPKTHSRPRRLGYCRQTVEAGFRRFAESRVGARQDVEEREAARVRLEDLASRVRELGFEGAAEAIRALEKNADPERELARIDGTLLTDAEKALSDAARAALRQEAEAALEAYRERMPGKVYESALESAYRRRIRTKLGLPTLSLYA